MGDRGEGCILGDNLRTVRSARRPVPLAPLGGAAMLALAAMTGPAAATTTYGTLDNFDAVNNTGSDAHGFEIDIEDVSSSDVLNTFGGGGRGFASTVERYGAPTITTTTFADGHTGVAVVYGNDWTGAAWLAKTPSGVYTTTGESCWTGGGSGYGASTPCDHFGVGLGKTPGKVSYSWLTGNTQSTATKVPLMLPTPVQAVVQPPAGPPVVQGDVQAEDAGGALFGQAEWVRVFYTDYNNPVDLGNLVVGNGAKDLAPDQQAEVESEWYLLQAGNQGDLLDPGAALPGGAKAVVRHYEFYQYTGGFTNEGEVTNDNPVLSGNGANVGAFIGDQNVALNLAPYAGAVPEPSAWALLVVGFAGLGFAGCRAARQSVATAA